MEGRNVFVTFVMSSERKHQYYIKICGQNKNEHLTLANIQCVGLSGV